jgi:hypothetical protein
MIGKFGENCGNNCSGNCEGGAIMCRHTDGLCLNGCQIGWNGTNCFSGKKTILYIYIIYIYGGNLYYIWGYISHFYSFLIKARHKI